MDDRSHLGGGNSPMTAGALLWDKRQAAEALSISVRR
jgi:hypothetical protein